MPIPPGCGWPSCRPVVPSAARASGVVLDLAGEGMMSLSEQTTPYLVATLRARNPRSGADAGVVLGRQGRLGPQRHLCRRELNHHRTSG